MSKILIDIWADIVCPFCYIGEVLLAREIKDFEHRDKVEVRWRSCLLMPELELGKSIRHQEMIAAIEDPEQRAQMEKKSGVLKHLAEKYGEIYNVDNSYPHNSFDAARLLKLASEQGRTLEVASVLGHAFFSQGIDLSDRAALRGKAIEAGLSEQEVDEILNSDRYSKEVLEDQRLAEQYAPRFVPTFYFNGNHMLAGIVKPEQIRASLRAASRDL